MVELSETKLAWKIRVQMINATIFDRCVPFEREKEITIEASQL
jgi:hypothetical protein